jgi:hypothetical protein
MCHIKKLLFLPLKITQITNKFNHFIINVSANHEIKAMLKKISQSRRYSFVGISTPGSLYRRVKLSLRVPAQMGWREMEHKGENTARVILRQGMRLQ